MKTTKYIRANKRVIAQHSLLWTGVLLLLAFPYGIRASFILVLPLIPPVYLHFWFLDKYYKQKRYLYYGLLTILTIIIFGAVADYVATRPIMTEDITVIDEIQPFRASYYNMLFIAAQYNPFLAIIISTVIHYFREKQQFSLHELQEQKTKAELELLKSQVNPHFFFNTLNTLFSMASMKGDDDTAEGISQLSDLMRYMIYDTKADKISLDKEIEHLQNFIELQKLRFSEDDQLEVKFEISGETKTKTVPPMLFIPFIENAYKFGFSVKQKCEIVINLEVKGEKLIFKVKNSINRKKAANPEHSGIGINNVRKRLEILFPDNHKLELSDNETDFNVYLSFPLNYA
ncbi:MAG: histidine kinase [Bacteroidales bacterium]|nr:histidine kinase [Bacteroidales bacterium]